MSIDYYSSKRSPIVIYLIWPLHHYTIYCVYYLLDYIDAALNL